MRFASLAVCAALIGGVAAASTPASAQGYGYGYGGYGYGGYGGYGYRRPWAPDPSDPTRVYRERQAARANAWRANAAAAAGDYEAARYYGKKASKWERRSRIDQYYSGGY